ncbi:MAG TPA: hypothetical protein VF989_18995 [Polyangiaceae bacterium]
MSASFPGGTNPSSRAWWLLGAALGLGCDARIAEPIVEIVDRAPGLGAAGAGAVQGGGGADLDAGNLADGEGAAEDAGRDGFEIAEDGELCAPCDRSDECGGENDLCVINTQTEEEFCGISCEDDRGCPEGFHCTDVRRADVRQCVPDGGECGSEGGGSEGAGGSR